MKNKRTLEENKTTTSFYFQNYRIHNFRSIISCEGARADCVSQSHGLSDFALHYTHTAVAARSSEIQRKTILFFDACHTNNSLLDVRNSSQMYKAVKWVG